MPCQQTVDTLPSAVTLSVQVTNTTVTPVYCRDRPDVTLPDGKFMKGDTARRAPCVFGILTCTPLLCIRMTHTLIFNYSRGAVA